LNSRVSHLFIFLKDLSLLLTNSTVSVITTLGIFIFFREPIDLSQGLRLR
jgi:hypothetical protein